MLTVILEGRDAPLYHCTTVKSAVKILDSDRLIPSDRSSGIRGDNRQSISFTRDKSYSVADDSCIQLVFDQRKLSQNYAIMPISEPGFSRESGWTESEERLLTNKPIPVKKYLREIEVTPGLEHKVMTYFSYLIDTRRDRWDADDKAMYQLFRWYEDREYVFGPRLLDLFDRFESMLREV